MEKIKALFVLAGYDAESPGRMKEMVDRLDDRFAGVVFKFAGLAYPRSEAKKDDYVKRLGEEAIRKVFGDGRASKFCRDDGSPCAAECAAVASRGGQRCRSENDDVACFRVRPQNLVFVCNDNIWDEVFRRFGRAALLMRYSVNHIAVDAVVNEIHCRRDDLESAWDCLNNLGREREVARLPRENFQLVGASDIAGAIQSNIGAIRDELAKWRRKLYDPDFVNPKRRRRRGGYRLSQEVFFQKDLLHTNLAHVGEQSRADVFHLINTYHLYGAAISPDLQFDVMTDDGGALNTRFTDILTGEMSDRADTHVDVTPCDRVI